MEGGGATRGNQYGSLAERTIINHCDHLELASGHERRFRLQANRRRAAQYRHRQDFLHWMVARADSSRIEAVPPPPRLDDFNEDLVAFGRKEPRAIVRPHVHPADVERFHLAALSGRL